MSLLHVFFSYRSHLKFWGQTCSFGRLAARKNTFIGVFPYVRPSQVTWIGVFSHVQAYVSLMYISISYTSLLSILARTSSFCLARPFAMLPLPVVILPLQLCVYVCVCVCVCMRVCVFVCVWREESVYIYGEMCIYMYTCISCKQIHLYARRYHMDYTACVDGC